MTWRRGFFRLWVVVTLVWVALAVLVSWSGLTSSSTYHTVTAFAYPKGSTTPDEFSDYSDNYRAIRKAVEDGKASAVPVPGHDWATLFMAASTDEGAKADRAAALSSLLTKRDEALVSARQKSAWSGLLWISTLPPITVLLIGVAIAWVLRGFRRA